MGKIKKSTSFVLAAALGFTLVGPTFAGTALAVEARTPLYKCIQCNGTAHKTTTRTYEHDEKFDCKHGKDGKDIYAVYEVATTIYCDNCSYTHTTKIEDHVFKACNGK